MLKMIDTPYTTNEVSHSGKERDDDSFDNGIEHQLT